MSSYLFIGGPAHMQTRHVDEPTHEIIWANTPELPKYADWQLGYEREEFVRYRKRAVLIRGHRRWVYVADGAERYIQFPEVRSALLRMDWV